MGPLAPDPAVVLDPRDDTRPRNVRAGLLRLAERGPTQLKRVRLAAVQVVYERGGAQARLSAAAGRNAASLVERVPLANGLGRVRVGDARQRAGPMTLLCDRMGLRRCLVRGAVPQVAACGALAVCVRVCVWVCVCMCVCMSELGCVGVGVRVCGCAVAHRVAHRLLIGCS